MSSEDHQNRIVLSQEIPKKAGKTMKTRGFRAILLSIITSLLLAMALPAFADPPQRFPEQLDFTRQQPRVSKICGFPVFIHVSGNFSVTLFSNGSDQVVRELDGSKDARVTWLAPTLGTSLSYPANQEVIFDYPEGGTVGAPATMTITGLRNNYPGQPADAGRLVYDGVVAALTPEGIPLVMLTQLSSERGSFSGTFEDLCAALTPDSNATGQNQPNNALASTAVTSKAVGKQHKHKHKRH